MMSQILKKIKIVYAPFGTFYTEATYPQQMNKYIGLVTFIIFFSQHGTYYVQLITIVSYNKNLCTFTGLYISPSFKTCLFRDSNLVRTVPLTPTLKARYPLA